MCTTSDDVLLMTFSACSYEGSVRGMNDSGELGSCNYTFLFCSNKHYIKICGVHSDVCFIKVFLFHTGKTISTKYQFSTYYVEDVSVLRGTQQVSDPVWVRCIHLTSILLDHLSQSNTTRLTKHTHRCNVLQSFRIRFARLHTKLSFHPIYWKMYLFILAKIFTIIGLIYI